MKDERLQFRVMFVNDIGVLGWNDIPPFEADVNMELVNEFIRNTFVSPNIYMVRWNIKCHPEAIDQTGQGHYISMQKNRKPERFTGFFDAHGQAIFESDVILDQDGYDYIVYMTNMGAVWAANEEQGWYIEDIDFHMSQTLTVVDSLNQMLFQSYN